MRLTVLSDARAKQGYQSEHGLSFFVEHDGLRVLFDTGGSDIFLKNTGNAGIQLDELDMVVLSHGHFDHGDGLQYMPPAALLCHPDCFGKRYRKHGLQNIGLALSRKEIEETFDLKCSREPFRISDRLIFLGEIPRIVDFESQSTPYFREGGTEDFIRDDSGLAGITGDGLVIVSGCAHSGICNMVAYAMEVTGIRTVHAVIGGFHLKHSDQQTLQTIEYLKRTGVSRVLPSHCTMEPALSLFRREFGHNGVKAGQVWVFP